MDISKPRISAAVNKAQQWIKQQGTVKVIFSKQVCNSEICKLKIAYNNIWIVGLLLINNFH